MNAAKRRELQRQLAFLDETDITKSEKEAVKKVARTLLQTLKEAKLVLDWRKKQQSRAAVYTTVKNVLNELPRAYTPELYQQKCDSVYQHVYCHRNFIATIGRLEVASFSEKPKEPLGKPAGFNLTGSPGGFFGFSLHPPNSVSHSTPPVHVAADCIAR